jgi:hypothetical protein
MWLAKVSQDSHLFPQIGAHLGTDKEDQREVVAIRALNL